MASVDITRIASNIGALNALNSLTLINKKLATHQTALSTGKRINSAMDDPAGLTIATKMMARSEGLKASQSNISDAKNMLSVAEGGMSTMTDIMIQMRTKAEQAASDTLGATERAAIATQLSAFSQQIQDLVDQTKWNGVKLLDNSNGTKVFQTGVDQYETTNWTLPAAMDPFALNLADAVDSSQVTTEALVADGSFQAASGSDPVVKGTVLGGALSELTTGDYSFKVLDKAGSLTEGQVTRDTGSSLLTGAQSFTASTNESSDALLAQTMTSGKYTIKIDTTAAQATSYTITKLGDTSFGDTASAGNGILTVANVNLSNIGKLAGFVAGDGAADNLAATALSSIAPSGAGSALEAATGNDYTIETRTNVSHQREFRLMKGTTAQAIDDLSSTGATTKITGGVGANVGWQLQRDSSGSILAADASATVDLGNGMQVTYKQSDLVTDDAAPSVSGAFSYIRGSKGDLLNTASLATGVEGLGLGIKLSANDFASLETNRAMTFEYIAKGDVKFSLLDGSNQAQTIAQKTGSSTITGLYGYAAAGDTYDSGRGATMKIASAANWDNISTTTAAKNLQGFTYERANAYSVNVSTAARAGEYMTTVTNALDTVTSALSDLGSLMARLTYKEEQTATDQVNVEGAYSRIMNANMAEEQLNASKYTILQQTATAMLAQANTAPQSLLTLFR